MSRPTHLGVDVSSYQGVVDWAALKAQGVRYAICKATEACTFTDKRFHENVGGAKKAGLKTGSYHFFRPTLNARVQAGHYYRTACGWVDWPPCLDLEVFDGKSPTDTLKAAWEFIKFTEDAWRSTTLIYTGVYYWRQIVIATQGTRELEDIVREFGQRPLWVAAWGANEPAPLYPWTVPLIWQFDGEGGKRLPNGVDCDFNLFYGDVDGLITAPDPDPEPNLHALSEVQSLLQKLSHQVGIPSLYPGVADGIMGVRTQKAIRAFQGWQGLVIDGIVGPKTRAAMKKLLPEIQ